MENDLSCEQWQAIAERLGIILGQFCKESFCETCPMEDCKQRDKGLLMCDYDWIDQAKEDLGYD